MHFISERPLGNCRLKTEKGIFWATMQLRNKENNYISTTDIHIHM